MEGTEKLLELMNKALPGAWDAAIKQVYIYGSMYIMTAVTLGIIAVISLSKFNTLVNEKDDDSTVDEHKDELDTECLLLIVAILTGILSVTTLIVGVLKLVNPEYHAMLMFKS